MENTITIAKRFNGPPESGNGGYTCGVLANFIGRSAEVTLRQPPPLERPLQVRRLTDDSVQLVDPQINPPPNEGGGSHAPQGAGGRWLIAEAKPASPGIEAPRAPTLGEAEEATKHYIGFHNHLFPYCFVCGPSRAVEDGLRIFAGPLHEHQVAAVWIPDRTLGDSTGSVRAEFMWSALDCPGYFAAMTGREIVPALLGRMTATISGTVRVGERCIVTGWLLEQAGRKMHVGTAVYGEGGQPVAVAKSTWITIG